MKKLRKVISLLLAITMVICFAINVSADTYGLYVEVYVSDSFIRKNNISSFESNIAKSFNVADCVFRACAGIRLNYIFTKNNTYIIPTYAAQCPNLQYDNYFSYCKCTSDYNCAHDYSEHHTSVDVINNEIPTPNKNVKSTLLLTGSHLCNNNGGNHGFVNGISYYTICKALISHTENAQGTSLLTMDVINELGHFYNVDDHYSSPNDGDSRCIWGYDRHEETIVRMNKICTTCCNTIRENKYMYSQQG